jgi:hypothetical protein
MDITLQMPFDVMNPQSTEGIRISAAAIGPLYIFNGLFGLVILFMKGQHNILGLFSNLLTCTAYVTAALGVYGMWNNLSFPFMRMLALLSMHCLVIRAWRLLIEVIG